MPESEIQLVVFDLGGVMIRIADGWEGACNAAGVPYRPFELSKEEWQEFFLLEWAYECGSIATRDFSLGVNRLLGGLYSPEELTAMYGAIICEEFAGIPEIVEGLRTVGCRTACLSNTCELHWPVLTDPARYPGIGRLDHRHASHLFGARKPDHAIFRLFEEATATSASRILFFDDRPENIEAARACGWHAMRVAPDRPSTVQIHDALGRHGIVLPVSASE